MTDWNFECDETVTRPCPMCGGEAPVIGFLGAFVYHRCRNCGWIFTWDETTAEIV